MITDVTAERTAVVLVREGRVLADSTYPELLAATGADDAEQAFLTLIDRSDADGPADGGSR